MKLYRWITSIFILVSNAHTVFGQPALQGAGATFPYPLYSKMFDIYHKEYGVKVNYQSIGSGGGIRQIKAKTVDFGASDGFITDKELKGFSNPVVHIPITAGADVIAYNLPGNPKLKLSPDVIADIFLGKIIKWDNPQIRKINPYIKLPDMNIFVVHRSDGSGTTFIFTDYLSKVSSGWKQKVGRGKSVNWPVGLGAKGNEGVAGLIRQLPGAIGYIELAYAIQNKMAYTLVQNKSGKFVEPKIETISLAAETELPEDMRISITNTDSEEGYPIAGFTWIIVYKDLSTNIKSKEKAKVLVQLLWWMTNKAQKYCAPLLYAPLSKRAQEKD